MRRRSPLHRTALRAVAAVALLALGAPACASILGDDFEIVEETGGINGGNACLAQGCESCSYCVLSGACADEEDRCFTNDECAFLGSCGFDCNGDQACIDGCGQQYPGGIADLNALTACVECECSSVCGTSC